MNFLEMTLTASVLILAITIIRKFFLNRLPQKTLPILWVVVLIRLLLPFSFDTEWSLNALVLQPLVNDALIYEEPLTPADEPPATVVTDDPSNFVIAQPMVPPVDQPNVDIDHDASISAELPYVPAIETHAIEVNWVLVIWGAGVFMSATFFTLSHWRAHKIIKSAFPLNDDFLVTWQLSLPTKRAIAVLVSDQVTTPLTAGIFNPVIILPAAMNLQDKVDLDYVLAHEFYHIKRFDTLWKLLAVTAVCLHWFNPFVWVAFLLANRDLEISCDAWVIKRFGENTKKTYSHVLISMAEYQNELSPLYNSFARHAVKERIESIMKIKKTTLFGALTATLIIGSLTFSAFAMSRDHDEERLNEAQQAVWDLIEQRLDEGFDSWGELVIWAGDHGISYVVFEDDELPDVELLEHITSYGLIGDFIHAEPGFIDEDAEEVLLILQFENLRYNDVIAELLQIDRGSVTELFSWLNNSGDARLREHIAVIDILSFDAELLEDDAVEIELLGWDIEFVTHLSYEHNFVELVIEYEVGDVLVEIEDSTEPPTPIILEHPFATALREFDTEHENGAFAFLVDIDGNGTQGMVAVNHRGNYPDFTFPMGTLFYLYNGELRSEDLGPQDAGFVSGRTTNNNRLVNLLGDGGNWSYSLFELIDGELVVSLRLTGSIYRFLETEDGDYWDYELQYFYGGFRDFGGIPITEEEFYAIHSQNGLDQISTWFSEDLDESQLILAMTITVQ